MKNTLILIDHSLYGLALFPGDSHYCPWVDDHVREPYLSSMQIPGTIKQPLEKRPDFPLNIPGWSEKVKEDFGGVNLLLSQTTGALTTNTYSTCMNGTGSTIPTQLPCGFSVFQSVQNSFGNPNTQCDGVMRWAFER